MKLVVRILFVALLSALPAAVLAQDVADGKPGKKNWRDEWTLPSWNIKTNLLYDLTTTINLGVEFRTGAKTSLDLPFNYNPWGPENGGRKIKHFLAQPEFRWWLRETFDGHFFGLHAHYALYNIGNLPHGPFSQNMRDHRYEGWGAGAGISYGYRWNFSRHWALEATIGVGYAYLDYDKYGAEYCGVDCGARTRHYFGPTKVGLSLIYGMCSKPIEPAPIVQAVIYEPVFAASFIVPAVEQVKARHESGQAFLDFEVDRSEILPNFRGNAAELDKVNATIASVKNNPDATVTGISIAGYASPESPFDHNLALSQRRAQALADYVRGRSGFSEELFTVTGEGEDWAGLEQLVRESDIAHRDHILEVINDESLKPDTRDWRLKALAGGAPYRTMLRDMFPLLRRSDYRIAYTVLPFSVEKGKTVIKSRPGDLSLNEMFLIANTYQPGSDAFNEVFKTAAKVFPDSDVANLNAAASAIECRNTTAAAEYLSRVKERGAAWWNNMGLVQWLEGNKTAAAESFANAGEAGRANAAELDKHLRSFVAY